MSDIPTLISRARLEMGDLAHTFQSQFQGDGTTTIVTTPYAPVVATSIVAKKSNTNGTTTLVQPTDYTVDERSGTLTLTAALTTADTLTVTGTAYKYFTDTDWTTFVTTAITDHLHNRQEVRDITVLPPEEEYPLAILAVVQALYALLTDASFDIDIQTPEGVGIPRSQRFAQLQSMLANRLDQYNKWCSAFNVGLFRIEMFDLRRKSYLTNRLVPIYQPQEFQDTRPPFQQFPPIDTHGPREEPTLTYLQTINLVAESLQPFSYTISNLPDLTGLTVKASVRRYPQSLTPLAVFTVTVNTLNPGNVTIAMDGSLVYYLGLSKFWDLQTVSSTGVVNTLVGGTFDALRQGTYG